MHTRPRCLKTLVEGVLVYTRPVPRQFLRILDSSWLNLKFGCFLTNSSWLNVKFGYFFFSGKSAGAQLEAHLKSTFNPFGGVGAP